MTDRIPKLNESLSLSKSEWLSLGFLATLALVGVWGFLVFAMVMGIGE